MTDEIFVVVWKIECLTPREGRDNIFYVIDMGDDPNFYCECCGAESNHLPSPNWTDHKRSLVGRIYIKDLVELAKKNPKGWKAL